MRWRCGSERALEADGPEGAEFGALAELGGVGRRGAVDFYVVGGVVDVAEIGEERETARERILGGDINVGTLRAPVVGAGLDAATGDDAAALAADIIPVQAHVIFFAG